MYGLFSQHRKPQSALKPAIGPRGNTTPGDGGDASKSPSSQRGVRLTVCGLRKSYQGHEVLKGVDFEVNPGEIFVIMGPSGAGKSVLLRQLIGLEQPDRGKVLIEGQPVQASDGPARFRLAMVFQSSALLNSMTVGENIGLYLSAHHLKTPCEIAEIVARGLEQAGLKGAENKMPDELSDGMRKRVAIARALAAEPQLILYDEPTSKLDPVSAIRVAREIVKDNGRIQVTTLIVSHARDLVFGIAHRIAMLVEGRIVAIGTPDEFKCHPDPQMQNFLRAGIVPFGRNPPRAAGLQWDGPPEPPGADG